MRCRSGRGRSGRLWGYEKLGGGARCESCLAKGLAVAVAIGRFAVKQAVDTFPPRRPLPATFGGNPFACRAALTVARNWNTPPVGAACGSRMGRARRKLLADLVSRRPQQLEGVRGWACCRAWCCGPMGPAAPEVVALRRSISAMLVVPAGPRVVALRATPGDQARQLNLAVSRWSSVAGDRAA